jgi:hypothetical protein
LCLRARKWHVRPGSSYQDAIDLVSHAENVSPDTLAALHDVADQVKMLMNPAAWLDSHTAATLLLRAQCNAHYISDSADDAHKIGLGLYAVASLCNHSCIPNCVRFAIYYHNLFLMLIISKICSTFFFVYHSLHRSLVASRSSYFRTEQ